MTEEPRVKQPHEKTALKRKLILAVAFVVVFFVGIAMGASGKTKTVTKTAAAKSVTKKVSGGVTKKVSGGNEAAFANFFVYRFWVFRPRTDTRIDRKDLA